MPRHPLLREISVALAVKLAALLLIWAAFFSPAQRPHVDAAALDRVLLSVAPTDTPARSAP